jgi:peptidoglycan/LPS O-acetylase OafA/YrhL
MATAEQSDRRPEGDAERPAARGRLSGFDGLRAVAALSLVVFHAVLFSPGFTGSRTWGVVVQLRAGVWIFFVISGFLLYQPYVAAHRGTRPAPGIRGYGWSRLLRIYPAYLVALVLLTYVFRDTYVQALPKFLTQLGLLQIYNLKVLRRSYPLDVTWSLATEITFYVFLPFFAAAVARLVKRTGALRAEIAGLAAMVVVGVAWQIVMHGRSIQSTWLPSFLPVFAVGMGLAVANDHLRETAVPWLRSFARMGTLCWALGFGVLLLKGLVLPVDMGFEQGHALGPQLLYTTFAFLMVAPFVLGAGSRSLVHRLADTRVMVFLGTISYGIFLWHQAVIHWVNFEWTDASRRNGATLLVIGLAVVVTIPIATASWYLVERPALRLKQRMRRD